MISDAVSLLFHRGITWFLGAVNLSGRHRVTWSGTLRRDGEFGRRRRCSAPGWGGGALKSYDPGGFDVSPELGLILCCNISEVLNSNSVARMIGGGDRGR